MSRNPTNFFTEARRQVLEDILGVIPDEERQWLDAIGRYSAIQLWPQTKYDAINNPTHSAFLEAIGSLINPDELAMRGAFLPQSVGGSGISFPAYMMALEILAQGNASVCLSMLIDGSVLNSIANLGDETQKERYVKRAIAEMKMGAFALTEPGHGTDAGNLETTARREGDHYKINGSKTWITNGGWADYYFVVARTGEAGPNGISIIMVHKDEITDIKQIPKWTVPGSFTGELVFTDVSVPVVDDGVPRLIGVENTGFNDAKELLNGGRVTVAAYGLGIATEALEAAFDYANERRSFGKPLISYQGVSFPLAEQFAKLQAYRLMTYIAAKRLEQNRDREHPIRFGEPNAAKLLANELAAEACETYRRILASYGLSKEYRAMQLIADAGVGVTGEGTAEVQKMLLLRAMRQHGQF